MLKIGLHKENFFRHAGAVADNESKLVSSALFNLDGALTVCLALAASLSQVHEHTELHGAVCPDNIDLHDDGSADLRNDVAIPLTHMSPEQTGRMNRDVDYRSDYYSLGVVFYQLFAGRLPFAFDDAMELVHSHIAKQVIPPIKRNPELPILISDIVMKLLAKNAEDRYQSLDGLTADLDACQMTLRLAGAVPVFELGRFDVCDRLQIPQKLYGREAEVAQLIDAFNRISVGGAELLLVTGYSGIGKSSLVHEIHKPVVAKRGYFVSGKFDQRKRNIPNYAVAQAFRELIRQILTESESRIADWKSRFLKVLGPNGQIMIDALPDLEYIIGKQPAVPQLGPTESQNRFNYVVQTFVEVFAQPQHPLVVFLDDLQWADEASLKLIQLFMTGLDRPSLLLIGAYRDNEVNADDSLMATIDAIRTQAVVKTIEVQPLSESHVVDLLAATVKLSRLEATDLAQLIFRKTLGNPFFVAQFIKNLYKEELLRCVDGIWQWNIAHIEAFDITDNVIDLLAKELHRLPEPTQHLLTLAACIGNRFDLKTLAAVREMSKEEVTVLLQPALQAGLVISLEHTLATSSIASHFYRFLHDRVQQAAYSGIPPDRRQAVHLQIGRLLHYSIPPEQQDERLFDIVQQLNQGRTLLIDNQERIELAELNLHAAKKGKTTVAYETVLEHASAGIELLDAAGERSSPLYFALQLEQLEASFSSRRFHEVDRIGAEILGYATDNYQRALVYDVLVHSYLYQDRHVEAKAMAFKALHMLGIDVPDAVNKYQFRLRHFKFKALLKSRSARELLRFPVQTDPIEIVKEQLLTRAVSASYVASPGLFPILIFEQVGQSLRNRAYTPIGPFALAGYAMVLIQGFGEIQAGYDLTNLALAIEKKNQKSAHPDSHAVRIGFVANALIFHWKEHLSLTVGPLYENYQAGVQIGEFEYATYSLVAAIRAELIMGRNLSGLIERMLTALSRANNLKQKTSSDSIRINIAYVAALMGLSDERAFQANWIEAANKTRLTLLHWNLFEAARAYLFADFDAALKSIEQSEIYIGSASCMATLPMYHLVHALCLCANYTGMSRERQAAALLKIRTLQVKLKLWGRHAPMNYLHKWQLVEAERYRIMGKPERAKRYYELAMQGAKSNGFINDEALACELAGCCYAETGQDMHARMYLEEAHARYAEWGAQAKVTQMEERYPRLLARALLRKRVGASADADRADEQRLDIKTVIKVSQTLSGEIQLDKLLAKLMRLLVENAGAQKGVLLVQKEGVLMIQAVATAETIEVQQDMPVEESTELSLSIVNYVKRTREKVVLGDATHSTKFNGDPYIERVQPKSVLCIPLQKQSELTGILYLENNLAVDAFTPTHTELLQILSTQIAISLENAGLYTELEQKIRARTQALSQKNTELNDTLNSLRQTQKQLVESEKLASLGQLVAGVAHEINTPVGISVTGASTLAEETERLQALYAAGTMKRSDLDNYVNTASTISKLLLSNMERASTLIQSFKEVAIDQTSEERRNFRLKSYIDEVLLNISPILRKTTHQVTVTCDDSIEVDTYPGALAQVLTNFVMNALLHAFQEGESGAMAIVVREPDQESIELRFSDNGSGIPEEHLSKIFDPFFTTMRGRGGSGLGLNIIHNLVTGTLQGRIDVESQVNVGTTFILHFPRNPTQRKASGGKNLRRKEAGHAG